MKLSRRIIPVLSFVAAISFSTIASGCIEPTATQQNKIDTEKATESLLTAQRTPTDISYSLERYNLIKRAYWVNGQREKAQSVPCNVERPIGYVVLISDSGAVLRVATVDGKVSSLNSYLSPDSNYYESASTYNSWLADVDGSYGENADGIFWFDIEGHYWEWTGTYLYSDIPFTVFDPILNIKGETNE